MSQLSDDPGCYRISQIKHLHHPFITLTIWVLAPVLTIDLKATASSNLRKFGISRWTGTVNNVPQINQRGSKIYKHKPQID